MHSSPPNGHCRFPRLLEAAGLIMITARVQFIAGGQTPVGPGFDLRQTPNTSDS